MRPLTFLMMMLAAACNAKQPAAPEKTYPMTATIISRDVRGNTVNMDNKEVPGVMEAMRMDYAVRGAKVDTLPPDGTAVQCTLHQQDDMYWVTDFTPKK
jgi:hypothetical protein